MLTSAKEMSPKIFFRTCFARFIVISSLRNEESAKSYFKAKNNSKVLKDLVLTPFQEALKSNTGYSKDNLPEKTEIDVVELGNYIFNVTSERKAKRPQCVFFF